MQERHRAMSRTAFVSRQRPARGAFAVASAVAIALLAGACAGEDSLARQGARATGFATTNPGAADFVASSRPADARYLPVGVSTPPRPTPKTPEDIKKIEAELESLRSANESSAASARSLGSAPPPEPVTVAPQ
jgi:hypothetical protein